jgi:hypothetical protein
MRLAAAGLTACMLCACGGASSARPTVQSSTQRPTALQHCVSEVTFWTPKTLAHDPAADYGDYQDLGLTGGEYAALKQTVLVTRQHRSDAATPDSWSAATKAYVAQRAVADCRVITSAPHPTSTSSYGWPSG